MGFSLKNVIKNIDNHLKSGLRLNTALPIAEKYNCNDWQNYCKFSNVTYKRNRVYLNNLFDIYVICWNNKQKSPIHDHADNGCIMKILQGEIYQQLFTPDVKFLKQITNKKNNVSYIDNFIGLHKIINSDTKTISLHIYSPPLYKGNIYKQNGMEN